MKKLITKTLLNFILKVNELKKYGPIVKNLSQYIENINKDCKNHINEKQSKKRNKTSNIVKN